MRLKTLSFFLLLICCLAFCQTAEAGIAESAKHGPDTPTEIVKLAGLDVALWLPGDDAAPAPLILFSHGFTGCKTQSKFLMAALAAHGYFVAAPDHRDAGCSMGKMLQSPDTSFRKPEDWSDKTYADRSADMRSLYDALKKDPAYRDKIDWVHVGLAGHSLGGYTVLGLAGGWKAWKMDGISAVLALSPYVAPFMAAGTLADVDVPVMYQGGTRDFGITPGVRKKGGAYDATPNAVFVEFEKTGHFGWTDLQAGSHDAIVAYVLWFFDKTLKGKDTPLEKQAGVSDLRVK